MSYFAIYNSTTGVILGIRDEEPTSVQAGSSVLALSDAQLATIRTPTPGQYLIANGAVTCTYTDADALADAKTRQINFLSYDCNQLINAGFTSINGLTFMSDDNSQRNIVQAAQSSKGGVLSTVDNTGKITRAQYTQTQAQAVLEDFVIFRGALELELTNLEILALDATTPEAVLAVGFPGQTPEATPQPITPNAATLTAAINAALAAAKVTQTGSASTGNATTAKTS